MLLVAHGHHVGPRQEGVRRVRQHVALPRYRLAGASVSRSRDRVGQMD